MKNLFLLFIVCSLLAICSCRQKSNVSKVGSYEKIPNSILIVYSSGTPYKTLSDIKPEELDAVSGATPMDMNVAMISQKLCSKLKDHYTVRLAKASEMVSYKEILQYDMLIIGAPTYFWNINWEIKKMIDEQFEKIYIAKRDEFKGMKHIVFAMSEYGKCAEAANQKLESAITDCSAKLDASQIFITKESQADYEKQISHLAFVTDSVMQCH